MAVRPNKHRIRIKNRHDDRLANGELKHGSAPFEPSLKVALFPSIGFALATAKPVSTSARAPRQRLVCQWLKCRACHLRLRRPIDPHVGSRCRARTTLSPGSNPAIDNLNLIAIRAANRNRSRHGFCDTIFGFDNPYTDRSIGFAHHGIAGAASKPDGYRRGASFNTTRADMPGARVRA